MITSGLPPQRPWLYLSVLVATVTALASADKTPADAKWYIGCYHGNFTSGKLVDGATPTPVTCGAICQSDGYQYVAVSEQDCRCLATLPSSSYSVRPNACRTWCQQEASRVAVPCGGSDTYYSVYLTDGPYLIGVTAALQQERVFVQQPISLEIVVRYAGLPNTTHGIHYNPPGESLNLVKLNVDYGQSTTKQTLRASTKVVRDDDVHTYRKPGSYVIEVRASNPVSSVVARLNVTVAFPVPAQLQLAVMTSDVPSCVPGITSGIATSPPAMSGVETTGDDSRSTQTAVFAGEQTRFEASVDAGYQLNFRWRFSDDVQTHDDDLRHRRYEDCSQNSGACLSSYMNHTFTEEGTYNITVTASNDHGTITEIQQVIAVRRELSHLMLHLDATHVDAVATPSDSIRFRVSMVTTDRRDTYLEVDFGDGVVPKYLLVDEDGRYLGLLQGASNQVALQADYGEGCTLKLAIDHIYDKQGVFDVSVRAWNNKSEVAAGLNQSVIIQQKLQGMRVHGHRHGALVGETYTYIVEFGSRMPIGVDYTWEVRSTVDDVLIAEEHTIDHQYEVQFPTRGTYDVTLHAQNRINSDQVQFTVHVEQPIRELNVELLDGKVPTSSSSAGRHLISTGDELTFRASVSSDNSVEFEWDFRDVDIAATSGFGEGDTSGDIDDIINYVTVDNRTSEVTYTFTYSGTYRVDVIAINGQNNASATLPQRIIVQEPIEGLNVTAQPFTLFGKPTKITAEVAEGSNIVYALEYNGTRVEYNGSNSDRAEWRVVLDLGRTELVVVASNGVSNQTQRTFAEVQLPVKKVSVIHKTYLVLKEKAVFIALQESEVVDRADLLYTWTLHDDVVVYTQVPVLERIFTEVDGDKVNVHVRVENEVMYEEKEALFSLYPSRNEMRLTQGGIMDFNQPINFTLVNLPNICEKLLVSYRHKKKSEFSDNFRIRPDNKGVVSWQWNVSTPGLYEVEVTPTCNKTVQGVQGVLAVQQKIAGIQLVGPDAVPLNDESEASVWKVEVDSGTHMLYSWSVNGKHIKITPNSELRRAFSQPDEYEISVNVSNSLGWAEEHRKVIAELPLYRVRLLTKPVLSGHPTDIEIRVVGGPARIFDINLGDGRTLYITSNSSELRLKEHHAGYFFSPNDPPSATYLLRHTYVSVGVFEVVVNVSNLVSSRTIDHRVRVEEPTTGVRLNTSHVGPVVPLGTTVVFLATVKTGKNLTFDWIPVGGAVESNGVSSTLTYKFEEIGDVNVTVYVTNALDSSSYVAASLPYLLSVYEPIRGLDLTQENDRDWTGVNTAVVFIASMDRGSGVTCHFEMGDGSDSRIVSGLDDDSTRSSQVTCELTHTYTKVGIYTVKVTAINRLGNVSRELKPFYVQVPPSDCSLRQERLRNRFIVVPYGEAFNVSVRYNAGTAVMVDWDMGDMTEYKNRSGVIRHQYKPGHFVLTVKCYNKAGSVNNQTNVHIIRPILRAQISIEGGMQHPNKKTIYFQVKLHPEQLTRSGSIRYSWNMGERGQPSEGGTYRKTKHYQYPGRYVVNVTAINDVSVVTSPPVLVEIIEPLEAVELVMTGEPLLQHELNFEAYHYKGSNVTYTWHFGDGPPLSGPYYQRITHVYLQKGEYVVSVNVSNAFGTKSDSRQVFVLQSPCSPPKVTLLEGAGHEQPNVTRGQEVRLEADVQINCSITSTANYAWSLSRRTAARSTMLDASSYAPYNLSGVPDGVLTDPILFIPRYTLEYGHYRIMLKVVMHNTIVYAKAATHFSVVPAHLKAIINGGIKRLTERTETVMMDGSASYDPDYPYSPQLRHKWACYQLTKPEKGCFKSPPLVDFTSPKLWLPGSLFLLDVDTFVFNLTISREDKPNFYTTSQVVEMKSHIIDMTLSCSECDDGLINSDQRLIVEARHPGHREDDLIYSWKLYIVADGSPQTSDVYDQSHCVGADGSTYPLIANSTISVSPNVDSANNTRSNNTQLPSTSLVQTSSTAGTQSPSSTSTSTTKATEEPNANRQPDHFSLLYPNEGGANVGGPGGPPQFPFPLEPEQPGTFYEGFSGRRQDHSGSGGRSGGGPAPTQSSPGGDSAAGGHKRTSDAPTEAQGSRRGGGSGFDGISSGGNGGGGTIFFPSLNEHGDDVVDTSGGEPSRATPHIVMYQRSQSRIHPGQTTTGTNQSALVFKAGVLQQGRAYIIEGEVTHKVTGRKGTALTYVKVNTSPSQGQCTLSSYEGTEMDTVFTVICLDWKDKHLPIQYEISYSLDNDKSRDLIYQGLNHETSFMLPAGNSNTNHTVLVNIAILDSFGARTTVCSLPVKVEVQNRTSLSQEEEDLYEMVAKENSTLQTYVSKGDNRNARLHAHLVAHRLNRLQNAGNQIETNLRAKIRTSMLQTLKDLPMRDEYEVQQTASAVVASTAVSAEMETRSLEYASEILEKASLKVTRLADVSKQVDSNIISVAIQGSSNIVDAASQVKDTATKPVVERTRSSIHNLTQTEVSHTVLGEGPQRRETDALMTYAGRFRISDIPNQKTETPNFLLPITLSNVIEKQVKVLEVNSAGGVNQTVQDCYEMYVVTYKKNPFLYGKGPDVDSQVASLNLFSCDGRKVVVKDLPASDQIDMVISNNRKKGKTGPELFELHKHQMKVHQFSVELNPANLSSLHIVIDLVSVPQGRLFPIALLLNPDESPTPDKYQFKKVFPATAEKLNLFFPARTLNESIKYFLGVVDANFNGARPRPGEVQVRQYSLQMWRGQCVYWDEQGDQWSTKGCMIKETSTLLETQCSCKHLTAFGAHSTLLPNDLHFNINVDDFFDLNENPVTFTLVITVLGLYIVLLVFCIMSDNHDKKKGAIVHLVDNSPNHVHTYVITMETGMRRGAGTSAKVSLVLHGKEGMSETRELVSESGQPLFERNSRDTFIITLPENMGQIWKVQVWHNNAGASPNWYLSRVIVKDVNNGQTFFFSCEKWFAVEEEDGKVEREIMVLDSGLGFAKVLWAKGTQYLTDYHIWFSMLVRPSYSRFTRAQRLTCCLAFLTSYMAVNAAWYKESNPEYRGEFGLIDVSWRSVAVGAITSLIVLPVNFLLVFIFRRSKIKKVCIEDPPEKKYYQASSKRDSIISLDSTVRLLQPAATPSIFDQSMLNWQTLQDWAQRQWAKRGYQQQETDQTQDGNNKPANAAIGQDTLHDDSQSKRGGEREATSTIPPDLTSAVLECMATNQDRQGEDIAVVTPSNVNQSVTVTSAMAARMTLSMSNTATNNMTNTNDQNLHHHRIGVGRVGGSSVVAPPMEDADITVAMTTMANGGGSTTNTTSGSAAYTNPGGVVVDHEALLEEKQRLALERELRRQHELDKYVLESIRSKKPRRLFLPSGCRYVAWLLAFVIIAGCSTITILYGFRFGKTKSILWLQSLFFSFIQCIFISHPFIVLMVSVYTAIRYRNDLSIFDHHDDGVIEQRTTALLKSRQPRRDLDEDLAMGIAQRQRSRYLHYARPPQEKQLIEARKKIMKEKKATSVLSESVSIIILLVLLFFVAYSKDISTPYRLNSVLRDILTKGDTEPFGKVKSVESWYRWSQSEMLDILYWEHWYNGQHTTHDKGYVGNSAILGTISLRQLRVKTERCHTADTYGIISVCYNEYSYGNHETQPYGINGTWHFYESNITRATGLRGKYAHYDGSGYQLILPNTRQYAYEMLNGLEKGSWIDRNTRAIIVEFTLYNPPTKLFSSVSLLMEQSPGGGVITSARVSSAHLFRYTSGFDNFVLGCELLLVVVTLYKLHCEVGELAWYKKTYFKNPWKTTEATVLLLLLSYIACYIYRFVIVFEAVDLMRATYHEEFVDVSYIAYWDEILRSLLGFIILLVIVQSLRLFRNRKVFAKFGGVYRKAGMEILYLGMMMIIWVCAYTSLGYALYGSISYNFGTLDAALTSVLGLLTGRNTFTDVDLLNRTGSQIFLVSFLFFVTGSLTAYVVAVLTFHYRIYRDEGLPSLSTSELFTYMWTKLLQLTGLAPKQPCSKQPDDPTMIPAEFRMAAIESQVDEMLFKMNALTGGSVLPEKPPVYYTDSDGTYGAYSAGDDGLSSGGSEVRPFDEDRFEHRLHKIEDNLIANEPHLAQLLQLDAMGVNVLSQERESQLRSALEFEIFWQLQAQRRNSADVRSLPSDNGQVVIHRLSSLSGSASSSGGTSSVQGSPVNTNTLRRSREPLCRTRTEMDVLSMRSSRSARSKASRDHAHPSSRGSLQSISRSDALVLQEDSASTSSSTGSPRDCRDGPLAIPLQLLSSSGRRSAAGNIETRLHEDPVSTSSCSSGGAEVRYIVGSATSRSSGTTGTTTEATVGSSPSSSSCAITPSSGAAVVGTMATSADSASLKSVRSLKSKTASVSSEATNKASGYDYLFADTSSGSEQEGALRASPCKARSLRKTRSRGKGKGRCTRLTPVDGLVTQVDEVGVDNEGYTSGSDHDISIDSPEVHKPSVRHADSRV